MKTDRKNLQFLFVFMLIFATLALTIFFVQIYFIKFLGKTNDLGLMIILAIGDWFISLSLSLSLTERIFREFLGRGVLHD